MVSYWECQSECLHVCNSKIEEPETIFFISTFVLVSLSLVKCSSCNLRILRIKILVVISNYWPLISKISGMGNNAATRRSSINFLSFTFSAKPKPRHVNFYVIVANRIQMPTFIFPNADVSVILCYLKLWRLRGIEYSDGEYCRREGYKVGTIAQIDSQPIDSTASRPNLCYELKFFRHYR